MGNIHYLYGAAVQGIQNFIFQTNELKDIVGASELVDSICTIDFDAFGNSNDENSIVRAAGNIKFIFDDKSKCEEAVRNFPKEIQEKAPGITISQAVVKFEGNDFGDAVETLEHRLIVQRNKPTRSATLGLMGIRRSRKTGLPAVKKNNENEYLDDATLKKREDRKSTTIKLCEKAFYLSDEDRKKYLNKDRVAINIDDITKFNDWIAIIHADGNGLGKILQKVGKKNDEFRLFSRNLDKATRIAARRAFEAVKDNFDPVKGKIPIRPVVLSGDDLTVIIRADLAIDYTKAFLEAFEEETGKDDCLGKILKDNKVFKSSNKLTACAGIAFIKSSYPFYYGYELAETLCGRAKKYAKSINENLAPSCLMFHKVQDSFVEDYDQIVKRELTPSNNHSFEFGPYFIHGQNGYWTVQDLLDSTHLLNDEDGNIVKSYLRKWMSIMHKQENGAERAKQYKQRMLAMLDGKLKLKSLVDEITKSDNLNNKEKSDLESKNAKYPVYDILSLHTVNCQETKNRKG